MHFRSAFARIVNCGKLIALWARRAFLTDQITYHQEVDLTAPPGGILSSIAVTVTIEPPTAGCLIYGTLADGMMTSVEVRGGKSEIELPLAHPKIYIRYLQGVTSLSIDTRGYVDSGR